MEGRKTRSRADWGSWGREKMLGTLPHQWAWQLAIGKENTGRIERWTKKKTWSQPNVKRIKETTQKRLKTIAYIKINGARKKG
ncbi:unnamed protein product [Blepharisma stoltei]|uniref:Uncharacterized protein n=1 Tax=Blepharisma stoltei TaxID=1481888 RepID=A0AAU9JV88_9CILI|nr:unnamed protein product [Blepharisma stoltei]